MEGIVKSILEKMSSLKKPQKTFIALLFSALVSFHGKANFRNLSRYSDLHEKRLSRWYRRSFNYQAFNGQLIKMIVPSDHARIAAVDASFMSKAGKQTDGLGSFWHGSIGKSVRGLELSLVSIIDLKSQTAYALDAKQTIDDKLDAGNDKPHKQPAKSRTVLYADHVLSCADELKQQGISHITVDAYYAKLDFVNPICAGGFHLVGKLRKDARLQWLYEGTYSGKGRPRQFDGKVKLNGDLKRFDEAGLLDDGTQVYSAIVHSTHLKRKIRVVVLRRLNASGKEEQALLYSTNTDLDAMMLVAYYQARFQIEFLFRDGKQHTGLLDCQARCKEAIHTHINASLTALNLLKAEDRQAKQTNDKTVISITTWKRRKFNQQCMKKLFCMLNLDLSDKKVGQVFDELSNYGAIAA